MTYWLSDVHRSAALRADNGYLTAPICRSAKNHFLLCHNRSTGGGKPK